MGQVSPGLVALYVDSRAEGAGRYLIEQSAQAAVAWLPTGAGVAIRALVYKPLMARGSASPYVEDGAQLLHMNQIRCGKGVYVDRLVRIHASVARIDLGAGCRVMYGAYLCTSVSNPHEGEGIVAGCNCWFGINAVVASGQGGVFLGDNVLIGPNAVIVTGEHDFRRTELETVDQAYSGRPIHIASNVWIGANATVLGGVTIGEHAVVAAGAVVIEDVPPRTLVGGVPARALETTPATGTSRS
jgi:acetyltransferase-like isoleucine patch superfamily enzyme